MQLDGAVYTKVYDAFKASYGIDNPEQAVNVLAQSAMRKEVGNLELDQLFLERERLNAGIANALDEASQPWGIRVYRYEIADIHVDRGTREAMEKQSNAERLRRAEVLESQGYREKMINQSEGKRQGAINQAQGEAESIRPRATAQAEEPPLQKPGGKHAHGRRGDCGDGLRLIASAVSEPADRTPWCSVWRRSCVQELSDMAKSSNMVIVPDRPNDIAGVVATAMSMYSNVKAETGGGGGGGGAGAAASSSTATHMSSNGDWVGRA